MARACLPNPPQPLPPASRVTRQRSLMTDDNDAAPGACKGDIHSAEILDEAEVAALVRSGGRHNDELLFSALKSVHTCDLHQMKPVGASSAQALPDIRHLTRIWRNDAYVVLL